MRNWRIYAIDGALLGIFMISACATVAIVEHPTSPVRQAINSSFFRRAIIGLMMGITAVYLIYSGWGKRSGAFMNPAVTLSHLRLGRLNWLDATGYIVAQFIGGVFGVAVASSFLGPWVRNPSVNYVVTVPGMYGLAAAWVGEFTIALIMISVVMAANKIPRLAPLTGFFAAGLVAIYITFEAPISGMSLNPARTFSSAIFADLWTGWWIYLSAPIFGMLAGIELHLLLTREHQRLCGKLTHSRRVPCFITCNCLNRS